MEKRGKKIFRLLADMLDYPTPRIIEQARHPIPAIELANEDAKRHIEGFFRFCLSTELPHLEKVYIQTFDKNPVCCPYVGHHLFAEDRSRNLFRVKMKENYGSHAGSRNQLPDHIAVMLRSLVVQDSVEEARELIFCCLVPAVKKMISLLQESGNPYSEVLNAVLLTLETEGDFMNRGRAQLGNVA